MPTADINGTKINYIDEGDGSPVLLIHAFPFNSKMWQPQIEAFGNRYRFIAPDLKGFGGSDAPEDPSAYTVDAYADELKGVLDNLGIERVTLIGLSLGGYVAFAFLRKHGDRVAELVLADTRAEADPPEGIEKRTNQQNQVSERGTAELIEVLTGALLSEKTRANQPELVERVKQQMAENEPAGFIGALEAMKRRPDSTGDLGKIEVSTLIVVGENDAVTPPAASEAMKGEIATSKLVVIPDAGHISNLEAPAAFNDALAEFLAAL